MLHIQAFGPLNVSGRVGRHVPLVAGEKRLALFLYLLLDGRGGFIRRDRLLPLLWPEADDRHARSALRSLIREVRNAVGDSVVLGDGDHTLAVDPSRVRCDVLEFESACRNENWERAVEEYRGPFLQGFGVSGAPGFEEWMERERNRLQLLALDACRGLARDARARGAHDTAVRALRKALWISPYDERVVQELMRALDAAGDRAGALLAYEEFAARIEKELEVKPGAKTAAVAEEVRREQLRPPAPTHALAETQRTEPADPLTDHAPLLPQGGPHAVSQRHAPVPGRAHRPRAWWKVVLVAAGGLVVLGGTTAVFLLQARASVAPEASVIAVAPFVPTGSDTALARLGRDLVITLSANLDGVGDIRAVDPLAILAQTEDPEEAYTREQAVRVARRLGASSVVHGSLLRTAGGVRLDFGVFTSDSLEELTRGSVTAPATDLTALTDSATWALLRGVWRTRAPPTPNLAAVTTSSIGALREFLDGEQAMFQNRWAAAESAYARAIEQDTTFWLAYQRQTNSKAWLGRWDRNAMERFFQHFDALPERERECWRAVYPWTAAAAWGEPPPPRSLSWHIRDLEATLRRYPDCWFGWWEYADHMVHRAPLFGNSSADAQAVLERFLVLMPRVAPAWEHLLWVSQIGGDTAASGRAREALERLEPDAGPGSRLRRRLSDRALRTGQVDSLLADSVARALVSNQQARVDTEIALGSPETAIEIGRRALELGLPRQAAEPLRRDLAIAWAARGAWDSALVVLDRLAENARSSAALDAYRLATVAAWLGALPPHEALARRRAAGASLGRSGAADSAELWWLDGILAAAAGDEPALATALAALRQSDDSTARLLEPTLEAFSLDLAGDRLRAGEGVARSEWALSEGQDQAQRAVPPAERVDVVAPGIVRAVNRLAASRWLIAGGDTAQAARLLHWHEAVRPAHEWLTNATFAALAYLELARIEEARGRSELARANYRQFLRRYDLPVPAHRHLVTEAEAALARLARVEELREPE